MQKWGMSISTECALCGIHKETISHIWFECAYVNEVADLTFRWAGITRREVSLERWMEWFGGANAMGSVKFECKLLIFVAIVYFTWKARNRVVHGVGKWTPSECALMIRKKCRERILVKCMFSNVVDMRWRDYLAL